MAALERNSLGRVHFDESGLCDWEVSDGRCLKRRACVRGRRQSSQQSQAGKFVGLWKLCDSAEGLPMLPRRLTWNIHVMMSDFHELS